MNDHATAADYAGKLLREQGWSLPPPAVPQISAAQGWARSGLMALTGRADGPPRMLPAALTVCADGALAALAALSSTPALSALCAHELLAERAALAGHARRGAVAPGGACRLLQAADGVFAVNLARDDDWTLLPAWLQSDTPPSWDALATAVRAQSSTELVARARELGLAAAPTGMIHAPVREHVAPSPGSVPACAPRAPRVLDLSTLWAGPLCGHLLHLLGADVVKFESLQRPDGARHGPRAFFDLMNAGKRSVALDLTQAQGRDHLRALLRSADIVIESSRPRALRQLGIDVQALLKEQPGLTWIALSGYGRGEPQENWIAYGDDAGVAAGLSQLLHDAYGEWLFAGDAIADPIAGLHAAFAAWSGWRRGGGGLMEVSLYGCLRRCLRFDAPTGLAHARQRAEAWTRELCATDFALPHARACSGPAAALGADTPAVLQDWSIV